MKGEREKNGRVEKSGYLQPGLAARERSVESSSLNGMPSATMTTACWRYFFFFFFFCYISGWLFG